MKEFVGYKKGVNFGGWISQCEYKKEHYDTFIRAEDFSNVKKMGYDHIRLPVDYEVFQDDTGAFLEDGFKYINFAIENCRKNGLRMILDLHKTPGFSFDPFHNELGLFESEDLQNRFYAIWEEFARRYAKESDVLCFELLNEVTKKEYKDAWNKMIEHTISIIRKYSKEIRIIFGGYYNNSVESVKDLICPDDENIVYTFHFYEPLLFTHQGAPWIASMDPNFRCNFDMTYRQYDELSQKLLSQSYSGFGRFDPDKVIGEEYFETLLLDAIKVAEERNVALFCGEFGVIDRADKAEAEKWFKLFYKFLEKYSIASSIWSYRAMDFGLVD